MQLFAKTAMTEGLVDGAVARSANPVDLDDGDGGF